MEPSTCSERTTPSISNAKGACCEAKGPALARLREEQSRVLWIVLFVNVAMFGVEFGAGLIAGSSALLADSLDMLGDAFVYGFSLFVLHRSPIWRARASLIKGWIMAAFGVGVLIDVGFRLYAGVPPAAPIMAVVGALALGANGYCFFLLWKHRTDDLNLRSTWLCSRNDLIANVSVIAAAGLVAWTGTLWPDVLVSLSIAALFLRSASTVILESLAELELHSRRGLASSR